MTGHDAIAVRDPMRDLLEREASLDYLGGMHPVAARSSST